MMEPVELVGKLVAEVAIMLVVPVELAVGEAVLLVGKLVEIMLVVLVKSVVCGSV